MTGEARKVELLRGGERYRPRRRIPAGSYQIEATFRGRVVAAGRVHVPANETVELHCDATTERCAPR